MLSCCGVVSQLGGQHGTGQMRRERKKKKRVEAERCDVMNTDQETENISFLTSTPAVIYSLINNTYGGQGHCKSHSDNQ